MDEPRPSPAPGEAGPGTVEPGESRPGSAGERMAGPRTPGEQRPAGSPSTTLVRRPSERYADASAPTAGQPDSERQDPLPRAVGLTFIAGVVIAVLGNFGIVTGLIVAAATAAWLIATVVRGADLPPARRRLVAIGLAVLAVVLGQVGMWLIGRIEGGTLDPVTYYREVIGLRVVPELAAAALAAAVAAR